MFNFLNKHFYIILILSTLSKFTNNKFYKVITWLVKIFVIVNIIFSVGYIIYFSYLESSFINGISIYNDLIKYFINDLIKLWNDLINLTVEDSIIKHVSNNKDINLQIKEGMREAFKEVVEEALDKIHEDELEANSDLLKQLALFSSVLFACYFFFILPGSVNPEVLSQYNWFNQSLIEFKMNIINLFSKPSNPGGGTSNNVVSQSSQTSPTLSDYYPKADVISPSNSVSSDTLSTITPNTPIASNSNLSPSISTVESSTQTINVVTVDSSTETYVNGIAVSKMVETTNIVADVLGEENSSTILNHVNSKIKNITD